MTRLEQYLHYVFLFLALVLSFFPIYWMLISATNTSLEVIRGKLLFGTNIAENYKSLMASQNLYGAFFNSVLNTIILTISSVIICSIAGYAFEIYHDKYKDLLMRILLLAMMIPFASTMIPLFRMFSRFGLLNTRIGFILPTLSTPFLIMLFRQSSRSFPKDLIDAARIDGLPELSIFFRIYVPAMKFAFAAAITVVFMAAWNSYLWPKIIMLSSESITMPMLVANIIAAYVTDYGMLMLAVSICTLPIALLFLFLQKSFVIGITGSIKG